MSLAVHRIGARAVVRLVAVASIIGVLSAPAMAQNKKNSWEVFLYFGGGFAHDMPSAKQFGEVTTYRTDPFFAIDPNDITQVFTPNMGLVGGQGGVPPDPNYPFLVDSGTQFGQAPCGGNNGPLTSGDPNIDMRAPYYDECDNDMEARYRYNASGITTNGEVQKDDSEFQLGIRGGYNITRHWQVEMDLGFSKQRISLTQNLIPLLELSLNDITDPRAQDLADFYEFTWANIDYQALVPESGTVLQEMPNVVASRVANDPNYTIPVYFPVPLTSSGPGTAAAGETFADVTGFVNRVFNDPTAFRNRGNQINIDNFSISVSGNYNFNTKADSRIIPYLSAGVGRWIRNFDEPYDGDSTNFWLAGGGIRFFVNEIFAFRADVRWINYMDDTFTIEGALNNQDLTDVRSVFGNCLRDQSRIDPPCTIGGNTQFDPAWAFPDLQGGGGNAELSIETELDDFYEIRLGFDVILGGK
jgi:hypothetical protein